MRGIYERIDKLVTQCSLKRIGLLQEINFPRLIFLTSNIGIFPLGVLVDFSKQGETYSAVDL